MPIRIKKPEFKPCDKRYRRSAVVTMAAAIVFAAVLIAFMSEVTQTGSKLLSTLIFGVYAIYFGCCITSLLLAVAAYRREDNFGVLAQGVLFLAAGIFCLMNLQLALALIFSAYGLDSAAQTVIGSQTYAEFIEAQYASWVCLAAGICTSITAGILAIVKLVKNR